MTVCLWEPKDFPVSLVKVHSSSTYRKTIRKCIIGVVDLLCLHRSYDDSITECIGYAFPKKGVKQCVVKVLVTRKTLSFAYTLTAIKNIIDIDFKGLKMLRMPSTGNPPRNDVVIRLSSADLIATVWRRCISEAFAIISSCPRWDPQLQVSIR